MTKIGLGLIDGKRADMLRHLHRAGGAVHADHIDVVRFQRHQRRADLGAEQHRAHGLHGDGDDDRHATAGRTRNTQKIPYSAALVCSTS